MEAISGVVKVAAFFNLIALAVACLDAGVEANRRQNDKTTQAVRPTHGHSTRLTHLLPSVEIGLSLYKKRDTRETIGTQVDRHAIY